MRSFSECGRDKMKAILAGIVFLIFVVIFSFVIFYPYSQVFSNKNDYEVLFVGASRTYKAIKPLTMDQELGKNTYAMASDSCSVRDRYELVESALEQESLETVVLDVSFDAMIQDVDEVNFVFEIDPLAKLDGLKRKISYAKSHFSLWKDDYDTVYPTLMSFGMERWIFRGLHFEDPKGFIPFGTVPQAITADEAAATYNSMTIDTNYLADDVEWVNKIIELCQAHDVRIVIVNYPDTEMKLWQNDGWNIYHEYLLGFQERYGIELYDFNLYKDRQSFLNDDHEFADMTHLSDNGADALDPVLADILLAGASGQDLSDRFYTTYDEAKANLVYAQMVNP